jgi:hypothetical protein
MGLKKLLEDKKSSIIKNWVQITIDSYAPDAAMFFKNQMNDFLNPVGGTIRSSLESLYNTIFFNKDADRIKSTLEPLIKIRAVQNFSASQAVGFLFALKPIIREELKKDLKKIDPASLAAIDASIDAMALIGFDVYVQCREKIYDLKTNEERSKIYKAFARAGLIKDVAADEPNLKFV